MRRIAIVGCGWLGVPLAKSLLQKGFWVKGSTTTLEKLPVLEKAGIEAYPIVLTEKEIRGDVEAFLSNCEIVIIDIPPKLRGNATENFVSKIKQLLPYIERSSIEKVVLVSSTSVYADGTSTALLVTESTTPQPDTESGKQLLETEKLLQNNLNFKTTVVRFGGLIGEDRHPIRFLAGRENLENPEGPINLIHQVDCIGIITEIVMKNCFGELFNAVAPFHPKRKEYYTRKALEWNLPLPHFQSNTKTVGKIITSEKVQKVLDYSFQKIEL